MSSEQRFSSGSTSSPGRLESTGRELGRRADAVSERVSNGLREKAHDLDATLRARASDAKAELAHRAQQGRARVAREVQEKPTRTLLMAVGAGVLTGMLLARRAGNHKSV